MATAPAKPRVVERASWRPVRVPEPPAAPQGPDADALAVRWQLALDAAERALGAAGESLPAGEIAERRQALLAERRQTAAALAYLGGAGAEAPWLSPVALSPKLLGLPRNVTGCLFDLEGVLTNGAQLQAWAWSVVFEDFLQRLAEQTGWRFAPFSAGDYRGYLDGRPRLEGLRAFLASRGISLPEGDPRDPAEAETEHGLARRKGNVLARRLPRGVTALAGARRYLQAAGQAGLERAVISASSSTLPMLELAGLARLVDERVDADVMLAERLRPRPAPDLLLAACRSLEIAPVDAVTLTHTPAGVAAGREAGLTVIGVADGAEADLLADAGAERVVPSVGTLLDGRLLAR